MLTHASSLGQKFIGIARQAIVWSRSTTCEARRITFYRVYIFRFLVINDTYQYNYLRIKYMEEHNSGIRVQKFQSMWHKKDDILLSINIVIPPTKNVYQHKFLLELASSEEDSSDIDLKKFRCMSRKNNHILSSLYFRFLVIKETYQYNSLGITYLVEHR